jgi:hypothetical protein
MEDLRIALGGMCAPPPNGGDDRRAFKNSLVGKCKIMACASCVSKQTARDCRVAALCEVIHFSNLPFLAVFLRCGYDLTSRPTVRGY